METKTMKTVFTIVERSPGKSFWTRVGVGFVNKDGSLTLRLDAIPVNGALQVRDWEPPYDRKGGEVPAGGPGGGTGTQPPRDAPSRGQYQGDALV